MPVNNQPAEINFVVPLYNEAEVFDTLISRLRSVMDASKHRITAILVDDGSRDGTAQLMRNLAIADPRFTAMILSRNWSHQFALTAGLTAVDATEAVMIDRIPW